MELCRSERAARPRAGRATHPGGAPRRGVGPNRTGTELEEFCRSRDPQARQRVIERYDRLARRLARRYSKGAGDFEDLYQVARLGILKALDRFDPTYGVRFTTFAWSTVTGELRRYLRDTQWRVHLPRSMQETYMAVAPAFDDLSVELGREPRVAEISALTGCSAGDVRDCLAIRSNPPVSFDSGRSGGRAGEGMATVDEGADRFEERDALVRAMRRLSPMEREVLLLHFLVGQTQREIARARGWSQMKVSRMLSRSIDRLRALLEVDVREPSASA